MAILGHTIVIASDGKELLFPGCFSRSDKIDSHQIFLPLNSLLLPEVWTVLIGQVWVMCIPWYIKILPKLFKVILIIKPCHY